MKREINEGLAATINDVLSRLGHGDRVAVVDHFFAAFSHAKNGVPYEVQGHSVLDVFAALLFLTSFDPVWEEKPSSPTFTLICEKTGRPVDEQPQVVRDFAAMVNHPDLVELPKPRHIDEDVRYHPRLLGVDDFRKEVETVQAVIWVHDPIKFGCAIAINGVGEEEPLPSDWRFVCNE